MTYKTLEPRLANGDRGLRFVLHNDAVIEIPASVWEDEATEHEKAVAINTELRAAEVSDDLRAVVRESRLQIVTGEAYEGDDDGA